MSDDNDRLDEDDVAPGFMDAVDRGVWAGIRHYVVGLGLAGLLTAAAFYAVYTDLIWEPAIPIALVAFAVAQICVHLVFFLHITTAPDNTNNVLALAFGVLVVVLIIAGSLWIMDNMNDRMALTMRHPHPFRAQGAAVSVVPGRASGLDPDAAADGRMRDPFGSNAGPFIARPSRRLPAISTWTFRSTASRSSVAIATWRPRRYPKAADVVWPTITSAA